MNLERPLIVALSGAAADVPLRRYADQVAQLNRRIARRDRDAARAAASTGTSFSQALDDPALTDLSTVAESDGGDAMGLAAPTKVVPIQVPRAGAFRRYEAPALAELANTSGADAILIGDGHGGPGRRTLATRLVRTAPCSVWQVPARPPSIYRRILVPVDFSTRAADCLRVATALAWISGAAECLVLHVYFHDCLVPRPEYGQHLRARLADDHARFLVPIDCLGVKVVQCFQEGANVPQAILRVAQQEAVDLIVLATCGRTPLGGLLRASIAEQVVGQSTTPVLVLKHFGAQRRLCSILYEQIRQEDIRFR